MEFLATSPPPLSSYIPLADHQSSTPSSFFAGPPVLYHHCKSATLLVPSDDVTEDSAVKQFCASARSAELTENGREIPRPEGEREGDIKVEGVEIFVTSQHLLLSVPAVSQGCALKIPYPSISLHAIQRAPAPAPASLYLQTASEDNAFDDHDTSCISLSIIPSPPTLSVPEGPAETANGTTSDVDSQVTGDGNRADEVEPLRPSSSSSSTLPPTPTTAMFTALSDCADLHPDPPSDMDGGGMDMAPAFQMLSDTAGADGGATSSIDGLPPAFPGSGGWITAENLHEHFDGEGNWLPGREPQGQSRAEEGINTNGHDGEEGEEEGGGLGPGAGSVRMRDEGEEFGRRGDVEVDGEVDGGNGEEIGGGGEETKWRRTG